MNKKVIYTRFHEGLFIPGFGNIGDVLPSPSKTYQLDMQAHPEGLQVDIGAVLGVARHVSVLVPWANIVVAQLSTDKPKEEPAKASFSIKVA